MEQGYGEVVIVQVRDEIAIDDGIREMVIEVAFDLPIMVFYDNLRGGRNAISGKGFGDFGEHPEHVRHAREKLARIDRLLGNMRQR